MVESKNGDEYPEWRVRMQRVRRSSVNVQCLDASWGLVLRRHLISMVTWG